MTDETLIYMGGACKAERIEGGVKVGGYLVSYGGADTSNEYFDADTDFDVDMPAKLTTYFHHGMDEKVGKRKLSKTDLRDDGFGVWAETILQERDEYEKFIAELALAGKLGWSSGTVGHLMEREPQADGRVKITRWPLAEASLTHTPAEPRNGVIPLKSFVLPDMPEGEPEGASEAPASAATEPAQLKTQAEPLGEATMSDEVKSVDSRLDEMSANIDRLTKLMEDSPAIRKSGYITQDGGTADANVKSFGDWLLAVKRGDHKRLSGVYNSVKDLSEDQGGAGGYLVPTEYSSQLLQVAQNASPILSLVNRVPVGSDAGEYPCLDQYAAPTAGVGNTAFAAGLTAAATSEGAALTETQPTFEMIKWRLSKVGGFTQVTNELMSDSPTAVESLLRTLFGIAISARTEHYILRGTGVGQPLGILNAPCLVSVTPDNNAIFAFTDAAEMVSRFKNITGKARWIQHPGIIPDYALTTNGWVHGDSPVGIESFGYGAPINSEHLPQDDNAGCVILADLGAYLLFEKGGLSVGYSEHFAFTSELGTWRFSQRLDGQPWMKAAITLADPQGSYTVSPFVQFQD